MDFVGWQEVAELTPEFRYNVSRNPPDYNNLKDFLTINDSGVNGSRWHMQVGFRYSF